jgi:hypothetical protein
MLRPSLVASVGQASEQRKVDWEQADTEVVETVVGVVRHLRRAAGAGLDAGRRSWSPVSFAAANGSDDPNSQLAAADVEMISGQVEAAFARLIRLVKRSSGDEAQQYGCLNSSRRLATATNGYSRLAAT